MFSLKIFHKLSKINHHVPCSVHPTDPCFLISESSFKKLKNIARSFSDKSEEKNSHSNQSEEPAISKLLEDAASFSDKTNTEWATTPYPATPPENNVPQRPKINPSETSVILFPGQGCIKVGDVKAYLKYPKVKELFEIANEILGYNLLKICLNGPSHMLNRTEFNQPATVVTSLAALEKLQDERPRALESCTTAAGYSIGELTALIFSGAFPFEEGLRLVSARATAMQAASEMSAQGMVSAYCSPSAKPAKICEEAKKWAMDVGATDPVCSVASYLYTQGKVFGGCDEALQYIIKNSSKLGLRKVQKLPVSGAFHTSMMEPALKSFMKALHKTPIGETNVDVYSNWKACIYPEDNEKFFIKLLKNQIVSPVKWEQTIQRIYNRPENTPFPRTFDMGSRGSMKTVLKMINSKAADSCYVY